MSEWKTCKLSEIGVIVGGATPSTKNPEFYDGDIPWITPKDLTNWSNMYISQGERSITKAGYDSASCKMMPKGSVLFTSRAPIGYIAIAANEVCTNQGFKSVVPNTELIDSQFLYYSLIFNKNKIIAMGSGTTFAEISGKVMASVEISLPPLDIQKKIAAQLSEIDEKIAVNKKICENLEAQAQALFKHLFVDFAPFKDGKFVESELGMIPKGWRVGKLSELIDVKYGKDHKKLLDGNIPVYGSGGLMRKVEKSLYEGESVLIPRKGTLNNVMYVNEAFWTVDTMFYSIPKLQNIVLFTYILLSKKDLASMNAGSAVPSMTTDILNNMQILIPCVDVLKHFNSLVSALYDQIRHNEQESRRLGELRDTLLPRLMSGELKVNDIKTTN